MINPMEKLTIGNLFERGYNILKANGFDMEDTKGTALKIYQTRDKLHLLRGCGKKISNYLVNWAEAVLAQEESINTGGAAFPYVKDVIYECGLTKREWFAGMALQECIKRHFDSPTRAAQVAFEFADSMLKEVEKNH